MTIATGEPMPSTSTSHRIAMSVVLFLAAGCQRTPQQGFEIVAPDFETARVRFANSAYSPVGAFAEQRGDLVPFMDANGDGKFDPQSEAAGRCDQREHRCWFDHARLRLLMTTTDCPSTTGTWIMGDVYDRDGRGLHASLCDDHQTCAKLHERAFLGVDSVNAIWIPGARTEPGSRTLSLRTGQEEFHYEQVALPRPLQLVDLHVEQPGDLRVSATADQTIDMAALWVKHGKQIQWSSADHPAALRADGAVLAATVPRAVLDTCAGACETYVQLAHVWRDNGVFSVAEIQQQLK